MLKFIKIWSNERIQEEMDGCRRNGHENYATVKQRCAKMKRLKTEYKKVVHW